MQVDISKIEDKDVLLKALWERSKPAIFFSLHQISPPNFDLVQAKKQMNKYGYADYICGRVIKANIYEENLIDPSTYDDNNGKGAFQEVVNSIS